MPSPPTWRELTAAREHRMAGYQGIRVVPGSNGRQFWAHPLTYDIVDDYGSLWTRGVFDEAAQERMPTLLYGHDWISLSNVLGRAVDYKDTATHPEALFEFDNFDDVPFARQAAAQVNSGTLRDMSVGFRVLEGGRRTRDQLTREEQDRGAKERIVRAGWDETSLVVRGAVPGAMAVTDVRMAPGQLITDVATLLRAGTLNETRARLLLEETFGAATEDAMQKALDQAEQAARVAAPVQTDRVVAAAELLRAGVMTRGQARHYLETGEVPASNGHDPAQEATPGDGVSTQPPAEQPDPGHPTPSEPGKVDAPPPVSEPGEGVAVPDEEFDTEPAPEVVPGPAEDVGDAATPDALAEMEMEMERARALATIGTRGRVSGRRSR